jgi:hypothetical protein
MQKVGKWIVLKAFEYPLFEKAHKLARTLTEDQIDEILAGKRHTRRNPGKRKAPESYLPAGE